jgi:hypothetical protein
LFYRCAERIGTLYLPKGNANQRGKLSEIGVLQIGKEAAAL